MARPALIALIMTARCTQAKTRAQGLSLTGPRVHSLPGKFREGSGSVDLRLCLYRDLRAASQSFAGLLCIGECKPKSRNQDTDRGKEGPSRGQVLGHPGLSQRGTSWQGSLFLTQRLISRVCASGTV